jgi:endonuclease/exonuclease/phosphatase family metal-dependent hydrolase
MTKARVALVCVLAALLVSAAPRAAGRGGVRLRVMTYNVHVGTGMDKKLDLARIAEVINRERPDLVALQEVDRGVERTGRVDQIKELSRLTKMDYAFAHNLNYQGGQYGVAVLSRTPILSIDHRRYQHLREAERRGFIRVEVEFGGRRIHFVNTHLDYQHADNRLFEARQMLAALPARGLPVIVAGDFNDEPKGSTYRLMLENFVDAWAAGGGAGGGLTYPADKPSKRIDYIFHGAGGGVSVKGARVVATLASDHLPLVAELEIERR